MTEFMKSELKRVAGFIIQTDPRTMEYTQLMYSLESLINHGGTIDEIVSGAMFGETQSDMELTPPSGDSPFVAPPVFEVVKTEEPNPFAEETTETEVPDKKYTLPDVRTKLSEVRTALPDFKIKPWLVENYNAENVTKLPEDKYADAMKKLDLLLAAKEQ